LPRSLGVELVGLDRRLGTVYLASIGRGAVGGYTFYTGPIWLLRAWSLPDHLDAGQGARGVRVLVDTVGLSRGGAERQTVQLAAGLIGRGHACLLVVNKSTCAYLEELRSGHVPVRILGRDGRFDIRVLGDLLRVVSDFAPDVVLSVGFSATLWGRLAAQIRHVPSVIAEHGTRAVSPRKVTISNRLQGCGTAAIVACAREQVASLVAAGNPRDRLVVIHNGVDISTFYRHREEGLAFRERFGLPQDATVVGLVAGHRREKRHDRFLRLIEGLVSRNADGVWGCTVGGGLLFDIDEAAALQSPAAHRLKVVPAQTHMRAVYSALDVVVLVSDGVETFPMCFLEAQACGCAVAGMDTSGVRSTFDLERSGVLVPQGDIASLVRELDALMKSPATLREMGEHGRRWVQNHLSLDRMVDQYEQLLARVAHV